MNPTLSVRVGLSYDQALAASITNKKRTSSNDEKASLSSIQCWLGLGFF